MNPLSLLLVCFAGCMNRRQQAVIEYLQEAPVLVLDEAQHYPPGALEEIRLLLGPNLARQPVLALVLIGDLSAGDLAAGPLSRALLPDRGSLRFGGT